MTTEIKIATDFLKALTFGFDTYGRRNRRFLRRLAKLAKTNPVAADRLERIRRQSSPIPTVPPEGKHLEDDTYPTTCMLANCFKTAIQMRMNGGPTKKRVFWAFYCLSSSVSMLVMLMTAFGVVVPLMYAGVHYLDGTFNRNIGVMCVFGAFECAIMFCFMFRLFGTAMDSAAVMKLPDPRPAKEQLASSNWVPL